MTKVPSFQLSYIDDFASKEELIDACMASAHIPFFLDWRPTATYRCTVQACLSLCCSIQACSVSLSSLAAARQLLQTELLSTLHVQVQVLLWVHEVQLRIAEHVI